jgi:tetratricopeptide (TPR) repeat protein
MAQALFAAAGEPRGWTRAGRRLALAAALLLSAGTAAYAGWRWWYLPDVAEREYRTAYGAYAAGDFQEALARLERVVSRDPGMTDAQALLGWTHWRLGELVQAEPRFRAAHEQDPTSFETKSALGIVLLALGRVEDALPILEETSRVRPGHVETRLALAEAYRKSGRNRVAVALYRELLARDSSQFRAEKALLEMFGYPRLGAEATYAHPAHVRPQGLELLYRTEGDYLQALDDGRWKSVYVTGVNLGPARPGEWSVAASLAFDTYREWLAQIAESGANTVRVYTILAPAFYRALESHNRGAAEPLWLIQEVWLGENAHDLHAPETRRDFERELRNAIDVLHGQADIGCRTGHYCGMYTSDVSRWVIGIGVGREVEPRTVRATNRLNPEKTSYRGRYVSVREGTPAEAWFAEMLDVAARYESETYNAQRPLTVVTWPPLDPMTHVTEATYAEELVVRRSKGEVVPDSAPTDMNDMDAVSIHVPRFQVEPEYRAGLFALYHVYQHWPDFLFLEDAYASARDGLGPNRYLGYLLDLKEHHAGFPLLIGEYGVSTSQSPAHLHPDGWHNGGLSEDEQAALLARFTRNIRDARMAGGVVFQWMDEWWKQVHDEFTAPLEPRPNDPLWMNVLDPEESFGIVGFRPFDPVPLLRGEVRDWAAADTVYAPAEDGGGVLPGAGAGSALRSVYAAADYAYLYLRVDLGAAGVEWSRSKLLLALGTLPGRGGSTLLPAGGLELPGGATFAVEIQDLATARLLIAGNYTPWETLASPGRPDVPRIQRKRGLTPALAEAPFEDPVVELNQPRWARDGREFPPLTFSHGTLPRGSADPAEEEYSSRALWNVDRRSGVLELRIPWLMLLVTDPVSRSVFAGTDALGVPRSEQTEGIAVSVFAFRTVEGADSSAAPALELAGALPSADGGVVGKPGVFTWSSWERVRYRAYPKRAYHVLGALWRSWPRFLTELRGAAVGRQGWGGAPPASSVRVGSPRAGAGARSSATSARTAPSSSFWNSARPNAPSTGYLPIEKGSPPAWLVRWRRVSSAV